MRLHFEAKSQYGSKALCLCGSNWKAFLVWLCEGSLVTGHSCRTNNHAFVEKKSYIFVNLFNKNQHSQIRQVSIAPVIFQAKWLDIKIEACNHTLAHTL